MGTDGHMDGHGHVRANIFLYFNSLVLLAIIIFSKIYGKEIIVYLLG